MIPLALLLACPGPTEIEAEDTAGSDEAEDTDETGDPAEFAWAFLAGSTYAFDFAEATIEEPAGLSTLLQSYLTQDLLLQVTAVDAASVTFLGALSVADSKPVDQDYCMPTMDLPAGDFTAAPAFTVGPTTVSIAAGGTLVEMQAFVFTGTFAEDGGAVTDGRLEAQLDTRGFDGAFGGEEGAACELLANFGATCGECPDDAAPYCLTLIASGMGGTLEADFDLVEVDGYQCEGCEQAPPADDAVCEE